MQCHVFKSKKSFSKQTQAAALASIAKDAISVKHKTKQNRLQHLWIKNKQIQNLKNVKLNSAAIE
jgi:hypothetical protein